MDIFVFYAIETLQRTPVCVKYLVGAMVVQNTSSTASGSRLRARSRLGSDSHLDCHSLPRRRFATRWRRLTEVRDCAVGKTFDIWRNVASNTKQKEATRMGCLFFFCCGAVHRVCFALVRAPLLEHAPFLCCRVG